jgi:UDP-N-acetylmuramate--alanine ligase
VAMGHRLSGSDLKESPGLERLRALGMEVVVGHREEAVGDADVVTRSTAVPDSNPEVAAAVRRGIPVVRRSEMLAAIAATRRTVAVAGTHGKTTTSSMLALILSEAGLRPSYLIGGEINDVGSGAAWSDGEWLVAEADESDGTFLELGAEAAVVTSVEPDHLEHYGGWPQLVDAFDRFVAATPGLRVLSADDEVAARLAARHGAVTFGTDPSATYHMVDVELGRSHVAFALDHDGHRLGPVTVPVPGLYNARNACAALVTALGIGAPFEAGQRALARFGGVARRFQFRGEANGVVFVDDYAHLPNEVASVIAAAMDGQWRRVVVAFQPHRYSRTATLWADFADAFVGADVLAITDIYPAGESPRPGVSGKLIVNAVLDAHPGQRLAYLTNRADLVAYLRRILRPGDLCLTLGAGDLPSLSDELIAGEEG